MKEDMKEDYFKSVIGQADYESGLSDAREAGYEMGVEEGMSLERKKHIEQIESMVRMMKEKHYPVADIAELTGMTAEQITSL